MEPVEGYYRSDSGEWHSCQILSFVEADWRDPQTGSDRRGVCAVVATNNGNIFLEPLDGIKTDEFEPG